NRGRGLPDLCPRIKAVDRKFDLCRGATKEHVEELKAAREPKHGGTELRLGEADPTLPFTLFEDRLTDHRIGGADQGHRNESAGPFGSAPERDHWGFHSYGFVPITEAHQNIVSSPGPGT